LTRKYIKITITDVSAYIKPFSVTLNLLWTHNIAKRQM